MKVLLITLCLVALGGCANNPPHGQHKDHKAYVMSQGQYKSQEPGIEKQSKPKHPNHKNRGKSEEAKEKQEARKRFKPSKEKKIVHKPSLEKMR